MPRTKAKKLIISEITRDKVTPLDIAIEERLAGCGRKESDHIIYVGQLVERVLKGEFGAILKALTVGRISTELNANRSSQLSSDRVLGRIEMANLLWDDLEQYVIDKDELLKPKNYGDSTRTYNYSPDS